MVKGRATKRERGGVPGVRTKLLVKGRATKPSILLAFFWQYAIKPAQNKFLGTWPSQHAQVYNQQVEDMLDRKAARRVVEDELARYTGPKYYISHFEVMNLKSKSTPCRIVFNSSQRFKGVP